MASSAAGLGPASVSSPRAGRLKQYLIGQFMNPRGAVGRLAGWVMANRGSNVRRNAWTVDLMALMPSDRVLEVGYGPGLALERILAHIPEGRAVGLDHSTAMHDMARGRNRAAVEDGRLALRVGSVEDLALDDDPVLAGPFDRILAVNVAMFWREPTAIFRGLADRLAEGGSIYVTVQPRTGERTDAAALAASEKLAGSMRAAGLADVRTETLPELSPMAVCVVGAKALGQSSDPQTLNLNSITSPSATT